VALARLKPFMVGEYSRLGIAVASTIVSSITGLLGPVIIARVVDLYIRSGDFAGVLRWSAFSGLTHRARRHLR
jgi:ABC-type multidrug transport system fused ATPase/permease subunit